MSEVAFPPENVMPASARINQLLTCMFLGLRKAATEKYKNADGSPLMQYYETLNDRDKVRTAILEYEITHGMVLDDRKDGVAMSGNGNGAAPEAPPWEQQPNPQPQMMAPAPVPVAATPAQATQVAVMNPVQAAPPPQEQPQGMPTTKGRRAAPKLTASVAPPVVTNYAPGPPPPNGATVLTAPAAPVAMAPPAPVMQAAPPPLQVMQPVPQLTAPPAPVFAQPQQAAPVAAASVDIGPLMGKMEELLKAFASSKSVQDSDKNDFKAVISNLSGQMNETNKRLSELKTDQDLLLTAIHWLFLCSPAAANAQGKANDIISFKKYVAQYLPQ